MTNVEKALVEVGERTQALRAQRDEISAQIDDMNAMATVLRNVIGADAKAAADAQAANQMQATPPGAPSA